ncbi:glycosyltransferase [Croceicoccus mobilis]|uniref:Glycosyl transferase n=1 Tax=Croceicoccus mobilis TaxID=1703339 RepID=A0A916YSK3_9SPHN|nr:glycosyltransferase [Croceicoccus mobilis]GGD59661.1 glycosyl transferase [Croceicoccus mobilis]
MSEAGPENYRVLHVAQKLPGGVGAYLSEVLAFQREVLGPRRVSAVIPAEERYVLPYLPDASLHLFENANRSPRALLRFAAHARQAILTDRPDIVHLHSSFAGMLRPVISRLPEEVRPAVVYCAHGWAFNIRWSNRRRDMIAAVERHLSTMTDRVVCISQYEHDSAIERGMPAHNMTVLHNGVTERVFPGSSAPVPMPRDRINLLFIGRKDRQKGLDIAEKAMSMLTGLPIHLHVIGASVIGEGHRETRLPNITHYGWQKREAIWGFVEACDAVLIPSRWEGFGLAAIEALRQAKPVIASAVDALPEVVLDRQTGMLFPPENPQALADMLRQLDRQRLAEMGQAGRNDFLARFTGERMNRAILDCYREVLYERALASRAA